MSAPTIPLDQLRARSTGTATDEQSEYYLARIEALQRTVKEQAQEIERLRERERSAGLR